MKGIKLWTDHLRNPNTNTLKTIYFDKEKGEVILHPENKNMEDMRYPYCTIQGVLKSVIKDVEDIKRRRI